MVDEKSLSPSVEFRLLGGIDVRLGGGPLPPLRSRREQWLLALLVLRHDRDTAREWLATTLWPDNDEPQALFYLRKSLSNLRQALGTEAARLLSPTPRTVRLDLSGAFADVAAFDSALKRAAGATDPAALLQEAIDLYRGPLLADCPEEWAATERNQREQAYLAALESLAHHFQAQGDPANAVHWLRRLVAADPYRESAVGSLMQALADCGDQIAVGVVYQELRSRLRQDLNAAPAPEIEALYKELSRRERPAATLPAPPPAPENRRHLPVPLSDLIGREEQIRAVSDALKRRRLVTLVGPGGIGKTRLAIASADAVLPRFEQGVWFVDLAALTDPALVERAAAKALGVSEEPGRPLVETLAESLSARSLLLVLDNCEHLLEACAALAYALLSAAPALHILTTSRQALTVMGEQIYPVPPLPVPPTDLTEASEKDPHFLMEYDAVRLFMDRAIRVNSGFRLSHRNASLVADICCQLDGIPLAIEMAAARLRSLSVGEIRDRLADRFRLLTGGNLGVPARQQTLRAAIDWSYDQLSAAEQELLRRLSVFAGGWTREAAEGVCDDPYDVPDLLASLVDKSLLLRREEDEESIRYGMLETIRQYGQERLEAAGERTEARQAHRDYFLSLVETRPPKLAGPERTRWLTYLETEHDNLRQALLFCREDPASAEPGLRLSAALWGFWLARGHLSEGREIYTALLALPGAPAPTRARADALNGAGILAWSQGDFVPARALHEEGLTICRELDNRQGAAHALGNLGTIAALQGDYVSARTRYEESLAIRRELGERESIRPLLNNLGNVANELGDYATAQALHEESLTIAREIGDRETVAQSLNNLGILAQGRGDYAAARALFTESLEIHREIGPPLGEAANLAGLGNVAFLLGDYVTSRLLYEESLTLRRKLGDTWGIALSLFGLAKTIRLLGDPATARALHIESLTLQRKLDDRLSIAASLDALATLAQHAGHNDQAVRLWGAASALREAIGARLSPDSAAELEAEIAAMQQSMDKAAFDAAWEAGREMAMEEAIEDALAAVVLQPHTTP